MAYPEQQSLPLFISEEAESIDTEFKSCSGGRLTEDLWKTVSAFSNTEGGRIIVGIDPQGERVGLSRHEIDKLQQDLVSLCGLGFNVVITPEILVKEGILVAYIPAAPAPLRPVYSKRHGIHKGAYVRIGSSNILVNEEWLRRFSVAAKGGAEIISYDVGDYGRALDMALVDSFIGRINKRRNDLYQNFTREEILLKQKAIDAKKDVTLFGLLAFGDGIAVQEIIAPTVSVVVTQYPGHSKVSEEDLFETYIDNREFGGNAREQFNSAFEFIKTKLPIRGTIDDNGIRRDYFVIPTIALREALANAIAHRDYSVYSSPIQVDIFSDRLEIINPGTSLVPINELDTAPSSARNPLIMGFLKEYGITDQKARGVRTIKLSLKKAGLVAPTFENISQSFRITLFASAFISSEDKRWLAQFSSLKLNERQQSALVHARNNPEGISNSEYRSINSMNNVRDDKKANKELKQLAQMGLLSQIGENKARRYTISSHWVS